MIATKSDINEFKASTSVAYALICKDALISIEDMMELLDDVCHTKSCFGLFGDSVSFGVR